MSTAASSSSACAPSFAELSGDLDRDVAPAMLELHDAHAVVLAARARPHPHGHPSPRADGTPRAGGSARGGTRLRVGRVRVFAALDATARLVARAGFGAALEIEVRGSSRRSPRAFQRPRRDRDDIVFTEHDHLLPGSKSSRRSRSIESCATIRAEGASSACRWIRASTLTPPTRPGATRHRESALQAAGRPRGREYPTVSSSSATRRSSASTESAARRARRRSSRSSST